jgi:hypothetical protein
MASMIGHASRKSTSPACTVLRLAVTITLLARVSAD